jgi:hypothetical protein
MARYRLQGKHYLNTIPPTQWEQKEMDMVTGKQAMKRYDVPLHLDPNDPNDHNYPGEIIVADLADPAHPRDIVFAGPPTFDMEPLDAEGEAKVKELKARSERIPLVDGLPGTMSEALLRDLQNQVAAVSAAQSTDGVATLHPGYTAVLLAAVTSGTA